jgi:hypothetical protein
LREYGKVFCALWSSTDFRSLDEDGRNLVLYLLTCPHTTIAGAFRLPDGYITEDLQWSKERVQEGFRDLQDKGFATRCPITQWVWIKKFLQWNPPENPNQWKAVHKSAAQIPKDCLWLSGFCAQFPCDAHTESEPSPNPSATLVEPVTVTVTVTETETGSEGRRRVAAPKPDRGTRIPDDFGLTAERRAVAEAEKLDPERTMQGFRDYWSARPGAGGRKADWDATWRVWCRRQFDSKTAAPSRAHFKTAEQAATEKFLRGEL